MQNLSQLAQKYNISLEAITVLKEALVRGQGTMAQFNHPELGGMGQWQSGGMIMIGDMFNNVLKSRIDGLCVELLAMLSQESSVSFTANTSFGGMSFNNAQNLAWWHSVQGIPTSAKPSSSGAQNGIEYAYFPAIQRLVVRMNGAITVYDTSEYSISGFSQQQSAPQGTQTLKMDTPKGLITLEHLKKV